MSTTAALPDNHPLAPNAALPWLERLRAMRAFHTGPGQIRDTSGPVAMVRFGPSWLLPAFAVVTSPRGAQDMLGGTDTAFDKQGTLYDEARALGVNVFNMAMAPWRTRRRALQPLFTKKRVGDYSANIVAAAESLVQQWIGQGTVDLDMACRQLTLRVLPSRRRTSPSGR